MKRINWRKADTGKIIGTADDGTEFEITEDEDYFCTLPDGRRGTGISPAMAMIDAQDKPVEPVEL